MSKTEVKEFIECRIKLREERGLPLNEHDSLVCYNETGLFIMRPVPKIVLPILYDVRFKPVMDEWMGHFESLGWTVVHIEPEVSILNWNSLTERERERIGRPIFIKKERKYQDMIGQGKPYVQVFTVENKDRIDEAVKDLS